MLAALKLLPTQGGKLETAMLCGIGAKKEAWWETTSTDGRNTVTESPAFPGDYDGEGLWLNRHYLLDFLAHCQSGIITMRIGRDVGSPILCTDTTGTWQAVLMSFVK
jgi:hypothetical protein